MPVTFPMPVVLAIFYLVFLSQIYMVSVHYPRKLAQRMAYVLDHFPPSDFPNLYPGAGEGHDAAFRQKLKTYRLVNRVLAAIGLAILAGMAATGYRPAHKGGDEIFVAAYFMLQAAPFLLLSVREHRQYKRMRDHFNGATRKAELKPRRLFDFVPPVHVVAAVVLFIAWLAFYLSIKGPVASWGWEVYVTLGGITGMNLMFACLGAQALHGKKQDPYKATKDQVAHIGSMLKVYIATSIGASIFLTATMAADEFDLEVFDPALISLYLQLCLIFGVGLIMRTMRVEDIDFEVYRQNTPAR